ncbi:MAG: hypothetical protein A2Y33_03845 [Spirochaetes bacterium GWF1_51_8]|nr:MAG: hypothetical protein A2Y33_03845 [Spirochaetes bacterium GWF1_51_8]
MKERMKKWYAALIGFFFGSCSSILPVAAYMGPVTTGIDGHVRDSATSNAIEGIRAQLVVNNYTNTTVTGADGSFGFESHYTNTRLIMSDIDGTNNGAYIGTNFFYYIPAANFPGSVTIEIYLKKTN